MAEPARQTGDRLPWLTEVPRTTPPPPATKRKLRLPLLAFLLGALFALIAIGAFWLGSRPSSGGNAVAQQEERPGMTAQVDTSAEAEAQARRAGAEPADDTANQALAEEAEGAATEAPDTGARRAAAASNDRQLAEAARRAAIAARRAPPRRRTERTAAAAPVPVSLQPVVRGRIIQTGAYPSRAAAELAWQELVAKWPYLGTKPRLISPLEVRSTDGRSTQMFRVQLATASQAQSVVICQRLTAAKQSCVVVY
ncbi:SPOR domain-containing protein [Sphingomonas ginsengisoli (ex An et al. 2013)]|uniref:SPOR domain-containing protein n=2 Tax=Sphingomonas TaxID=13687 RepID=UPI001269D053|nr:SPOR domain-containing protein [Sphingomonas ginsengisoli An et al. 2013]